jgi:hypothetical protein
MNPDPERIGSPVMGRQKWLGVFGVHEIQQLGEAVEAVAQPFATVPHFQKSCVGRSA